MAFQSFILAGIEGAVVRALSSQIAKDIALVLGVEGALSIASNLTDSTADEICDCLEKGNQTLESIQQTLVNGFGQETIELNKLLTKLADNQLATDQRQGFLDNPDLITINGKPIVDAEVSNDLERQIRELERFRTSLLRDLNSLQTRIGEQEALNETSPVGALTDPSNITNNIVQLDEALTEFLATLVPVFATLTASIDSLVDKLQLVIDAGGIGGGTVINNITGSSMPLPNLIPTTSPEGDPAERLAMEEKVTAEILEVRQNLARVTASINSEAMEQLNRSVEEFRDRSAAALADLVLTGEFSAKKLGQVFKQLAFDVARQQLTSLFSNILGVALGLPGRMGGGRVSGGRAFVVGERGPELFVPDLSGRILPSAVTAGAMGGGVGGNQVHLVQNNTYTVDVANTVRVQLANFMPVIVQATTQAVFDALRRR